VIGVLVGLLPLGLTMGTAASVVDVMHRLQPARGSVLSGVLDGLLLAAVGASAHLMFVMAGVA
jgi:hypothetical protein